MKPLILVVVAFFCQLAEPTAPLLADEPAASRIEEIRKLIRCAERYHSFDNDRRHGSLEWAYMDALIAARRFDDAFSKIKNSSVVAVEKLEDYCVAKWFAGEAENMTAQIAEIASIHGEEFERHDADELEKLKRTATVLEGIKNEDEMSIDAAHACLAEDHISFGSRGRHQFWIRAMLASGGSEAVAKLVDRIAESIEDPTDRDARKVELILHTKPRSAFHEYHRQKRLALMKVEYESLMQTSRMPIADWLWSSLKVLQRQNINQKQREELVAEVLELLQDESLEDDTCDQIRGRLLNHLAKNGDWSRVFEITDRNPPKHIYNMMDLCLVAGMEDRERLNKLVQLLPDVRKESHDYYSEKLMTLLIRAGHLDKAEKNVDSLSEGSVPRYRKIINFYRLLHDSDFSDIPKFAAAYAAFTFDGEYESTFYITLLNDVGTDHLAEIAIRNSPAVALRLARTIPTDNYYNKQNALGFCVSALLERKRMDLALKMVSLAKPQEVENARLTYSKETLALFDDSAWKQFEALAPNDSKVLANLIRMAVAEGNKSRSLMLAKRALIHHRNVAGTESLFVEAGWVPELLDVSNVVKMDDSGNPIFGRFQKLFATRVGEKIKFRDADEAIEYSRKHVGRGDPGAKFLLDLAIRMAETD